jgi:hypothetical protein
MRRVTEARDTRFYGASEAERAADCAGAARPTTESATARGSCSVRGLTERSSTSVSGVRPELPRRQKVTVPVAVTVSTSTSGTLC